MESSRDITVASSNNGADDIIEETYPCADADSGSIRNRIACKTGHILNNLTSSVWYSYALLYFQHVAGLSAVSVGIIFFISQTLMAGSSLLITLGREKHLWKYFSPYGKRKAWHIIGSAGVLFSWPFIFTPCLFCENNSSHVTLGAYYLLSVALFSISWPLAEDSYYSLMTEIREENGKDTEASRYVGDKFSGLWTQLFIISISNSTHCWNYTYYFSSALIWETNSNLIHFKASWIKYSIVIPLVACQNILV